MKQTIIYRLNPIEEQENHLHNLCSIATKLYNTDNYQRIKDWEKTGKIPNAYAQKKALKDNVWFKLLPSQTAQEVCFNLQNNYKSWFKLRKKDKDANPPRFRKKEMLSPITFYQQFKIRDNKIILSVSRKYKEEKGIKSIEVEFNKWKVYDDSKAKMCQILFNKGKWYAHIVYEIIEPEIKLNDKIMAIDVGIINIASCITNKGFSEIHSGKGILSAQHYFNSRKARVQSKLMKQFPKRYSSRTLRNLNIKQKRQINQMIHNVSRNIIDRAKELDVKTIVIGDITDIRKDKNLGRNNQKLHSWSFSKLTQQIEYKAILSGIRFVRVSEENTSKTCSCCGTVRKSNRIYRGLYKCKTCGNVINADINGACNILRKYLQIFPKEDRSIGEVASPLVSRIENVIPK